MASQPQAQSNTAISDANGFNWSRLSGWILMLVFVVMVHDPASVPTRVYAPAVAVIFGIGLLLDLYLRRNRT